MMKMEKGCWSSNIWPYQSPHCQVKENNQLNSFSMYVYYNRKERHKQITDGENLHVQLCCIRWLWATILHAQYVACGDNTIHNCHDLNAHAYLRDLCDHHARAYLSHWWFIFLSYYIMLPWHGIKIPKWH